MKKVFMAVMILMIMTALFTNPSYANGPFTKLGRGLMNIATGWIELPVTMYKSYMEHDYIGGIFYGVPAGVVRTLLRTLGGVYEVATFPFPIPRDYEPVIEPEFVMKPFLEKMRDVEDY